MSDQMNPGNMNTAADSGALELPAGCLFDFDGVIVDSFAMNVEAWRQSFEDVFGRAMPELPPEELTGRSARRIAHELAVLGDDPQRAEEIFSRKEDLLNGGDLLPPLRPGVHAVIAWCREHGIPFGVGSNAPGEYIRETLTGHGLEIPVVLGFDEVAKPKPAPDLYIECARKADIPAADFGRVLVFEDSPPGVTAAAEAGMYPVGILAHIKAENLLHCGAREIHDDLAAWLETR